MRKLTTKLLFAIISAAFALVALGTTTFAWFTLTNEATISQFNAQITAGEGIEISLDNITYYTTIPESVIQAKINSMNIELKDVTSSNGIVMTKMNGTTVSFLPAPGEKNEFIQFDLWVRSPEANAKIALNNYTFSSSETTWKADADFISSFGDNVIDVEAGEEGTYYAHAALRMSLTPVTGGTESVAQVYQAPGVDNVNKVIGTEPIPQGMVSYYKAKNGENSINISGVTIADALTSASSTEIITLSSTPNEASVIRVRVWIEGWDPDCFNAILNSKINVSFGLIKVVNQG
ncbi:MAG: hypothetical protein PHG08_05775 [Bacilli bacterium]|nr:hypothetical protein [Bacilli bacterium]